jgi:hypothetical protein
MQSYDVFSLSGTGRRRGICFDPWDTSPVGQGLGQALSSLYTALAAIPIMNIYSLLQTRCLHLRPAVRSVVLAFGVLLAGLLLPQSAQAVPVDLELALLVDVSGSVDGPEWALQRDGYVAALTSQTFIDAVQDGNIGAIALTFMYWSGATQQYQTVGWTLINSAGTAQAFAASIALAPRPTGFLTAPGSAINAIVPTFATNGFEGNYQKIDVSGDGSQNDGASTSTAAANALAAGIDQINGLPIGNQALIDWYAANVLGGTGAFNQPATSFATFQPALLTKLQTEVSEASPVPEPSSMLLFGGALLAGAWFRKRR